MQILIVEDERLVAQDLEQTLYSMGYGVTAIVDRGDDALRSATDERPDLVLMDIRLQGMMDGITLAQHMRDLFQLPVIYLTAYADVDTVRRAASTEPFGYLIKPFDERELQVAIELAVYKHRIDLELRCSIEDRLRAERELQHANVALQAANADLAASNLALEQRRAEIGVLSQLGGDLLRVTTAAEAYAVIGQAARHLFPGTGGMLYIRRPHQPRLESVAVWGFSDGAEERLLPEACLALTTGSLLISDRASPGCNCAVGWNRTRRVLCVPLIADGALFGMLRLILPIALEAPAFVAEARGHISRLVVALSEQAALGLANVCMRETLREQAIRDPLTGLYNRRYMESSLDRELRRAARNCYPIGVIMLDIDYFKSINDTHGHDAGDAVLRAIGSFLLGSIRAEDIACRYGGEEFVLILPAAPPAVTVARAEQIRLAIRGLRIWHDSTSLGPVTISVGVAIVPDHGVSVAQALALADAALYRAKHAGRDRIMVS